MAKRHQEVSEACVLLCFCNVFYWVSICSVIKCTQTFGFPFITSITCEELISLWSLKSGTRIFQVNCKYALEVS